MAIAIFQVHRIFKVVEGVIVHLALFGFKDKENGRLVLALKDSWLPVASATSLYNKMGKALKEATDYEGDPRELTRFCTSAVAYRRSSRQGEATGSRLGFIAGKAAGSSIEGRRDNYSREN